MSSSAPVKKSSIMLSPVCTSARVFGSITLIFILALLNVVAFYRDPRSGFGLPFLSFGFQRIDGQYQQLLQDDYSRCESRATNPSRAPPSTNGSLYSEVAYPVCMLMAFGQDTADPKQRALPFFILYRLFDFAKAELSTAIGALRKQRNSGKWTETSSPVNLLVAVDYDLSIACKMARDFLQDAGAEFEGVQLTCHTPSDSKRDSSALSCGVAIVGESERYVPQLIPEWTKQIQWNLLRFVDLDESDCSRAPPALPREMWRPTVVTAFSSNHIRVGLLLLRSIGMAGKRAADEGSYNISVVVYALEDFNPTRQGLLNCVLRELNEEYRIPTELRQFNFSAYPSWMTINQTKGRERGLGEYAWKAIIVHSVLVERGFVFWTDAGDRMVSNGLSETLDFTREHGFASTQTAGHVPDWIHPLQLKYFRYRVHRGVFNCDGSRVGLTLDKYSLLARPWYECSMTRQCIAPDGSNRTNHRQDQAALTLLADMSGSRCKGISEQVYRHRDYRTEDYAGVSPTKCYDDPLEVVEDWV